MTSRYRLPALLLALLAGVALPASAQKGPPTAVIVSGPDVGADAPDFRLPWAS
jgi:hypothetical protein